MNKIEFVLVLIFTFFVIVVWVTSEVILVRPNVPDDPKIQSMIEPLQPTFDLETLKRVETLSPAPPIKSAVSTVPSPLPATAAASLQPRPTSSPIPRPTPTPSSRIATQAAQQSTNSATIAP